MQSLFLRSLKDRFDSFSSREKILSLAVVAALIFLIFFSISRLFKKKEEQSPVPAQTQTAGIPGDAPAAVAASVEAPLLPQKKLVMPEFKRPWGRNPFEESGVGVEKTLPKTADNIDTGFSLTGVMMLGSKKVAIMAGRFVREGDEIGGAKVERIEDDRVFLKENGNEIIVRMETV